MELVLANRYVIGLTLWGVHILKHTKTTCIKTHLHHRRISVILASRGEAALYVRHPDCLLLALQTSETQSIYWRSLIEV